MIDFHPFVNEVCLIILPKEDKVCNARDTNMNSAFVM